MKKIGKKLINSIVIILLIYSSIISTNAQTWFTNGITVAGGNGSGNAANQLSNPQGIFIAANGNIFVADANNHRIQKWATPYTTGVTAAGGNSVGSAVNQLNYPASVTVDQIHIQRNGSNKRHRTNI